MLNTLSRPMVRIVDRYLPDPFVFVLVLTLVAGVAAALVQGTGPLAITTMWGDGFWSLLSFSMQMLLVLVTGYLMASPLWSGAAWRHWPALRHRPGVQSCWSASFRSPPAGSTGASDSSSVPFSPRNSPGRSRSTTACS